MNQKFRFEFLIEFPEREEYIITKRRACNEEDLDDRELWILQNFSGGDFE